jgi:hypothetical protein
MRRRLRGAHILIVIGVFSACLPAFIHHLHAQVQAAPLVISRTAPIIVRAAQWITGAVGQWAVGEALDEATGRTTRNEVAAALRELQSTASSAATAAEREAINQQMRRAQDQLNAIDEILQRTSLTRARMQDLLRQQDRILREMRAHERALGEQVGLLAIQVDSLTRLIQALDTRLQSLDHRPGHVGTTNAPHVSPTDEFPRPGTHLPGVRRTGPVPAAFNDNPVSISDWVQTDGRYIYYRYDLYLGDECCDRVRAVGNWPGRGWEWNRGLRVERLDSNWFRVDMFPLLRSPFDARTGVTYCVNFWDGRRRWGMHGSEEAPGLHERDTPSIVVYSPAGDRNIGFAFTTHAGQTVVELTNRFRGARC